MKHLIAAALAVAFATPAMAAPYAGVSLGRADQKLSAEGITLSDTDNSFKVVAGVQVNPHFALEAGYAVLGEAGVRIEDASLTAKPKTAYGALVGSVPLNDVLTLSGKVGMARSSTTISADFMGESESVKETGNSAMFGIGAAFALGAQVALVAEYENFGKIAKDDESSLKASQVSVGLRFRF